jgi:hypothetical protein
MPKLRTFGFDYDTLEYSRRVFDGSGRQILLKDLWALNRFVVRLKQARLWDKIVCWPMGSLLNAGQGGTVYSLGGADTHNVSIIGAEWSIEGMVFSVNDHRLQAPSAKYPTATGFTYICYKKIRNTATNIRLYAGSPSLNTRSYLYQAINQATIYAWVDRSDQASYQQWVFNSGYLGNLMIRSVGWTQRSDYSTTSAYVNGIKCSGGTFDGTKPWSQSSAGIARFIYQSGTEANNGYIVPFFAHGMHELTDFEHAELDRIVKTSVLFGLGFSNL